jgi:hypothetical protein
VRRESLAGSGFPLAPAARQTVLIIGTHAANWNVFSIFYCNEIFFAIHCEMA